MVRIYAGPLSQECDFVAVEAEKATPAIDIVQVSNIIVCYMHDKCKKRVATSVKMYHSGYVCGITSGVAQKIM